MMKHAQALARRRLRAGMYTRRLAAAGGGRPAAGVDASEAMIATATKRGESNLTYLRCDACSLPFADEAFNASLQRRRNPHARSAMSPPAVGEMVRVLKPGGRLGIVGS